MAEPEPLSPEEMDRDRARHRAMHRFWSSDGQGTEVRATCTRCRIIATLDAFRDDPAAAALSAAIDEVKP